MPQESILWVGTFPGLGSYSIGQDIASRLRNAGWRITLTSKKEGVASRVADMVATVWSARNSYTLAHVDVYSGRAFLWAEAVCMLLRKLGKPYVLTLRGGGLPTFAARHPRRCKRLLHSSQAVIAPSSYLADAMGGYARGIQVIPNALDLTAYGNGSAPEPIPEMIWLRAFHEAYNPSLAPKVLKLVSQHFSEAHLSMIGPDKGDGSLQRTRSVAKSLGVLDRLEIIPGIPKRSVPHHLRRKSIFLNTTNVDNTPVSLLEAMASGLCVISTNVGGIPDLITHDYDAILVEPRDPEAMADAVVGVVADPAKFSLLSRRAREKAECLDWSEILPQWERLFRQVADDA